jgi:hypothetical protein
MHSWEWIIWAIGRMKGKGGEDFAKVLPIDRCILKMSKAPKQPEALGKRRERVLW